ncbi:hypothetical protein [Nocardia sp. BMG111209]|uniref:hypothetical protein n=1 Tax=Nocardia sp. BMG111209 TaxID=1160137 RepID=UPI0003698A59|nr:hypothetical protein [Nocardia sp. BMG111209]
MQTDEDARVVDGAIFAELDVEMRVSREPSESGAAYTPDLGRVQQSGTSSKTEGVTE